MLIREIKEELSEQYAENLIAMAKQPRLVEKPSIFFSDSHRKLLWRLQRLELLLQEAYKLSYRVSKVFVTFDLEDEQRQALESLTISFFQSVTDEGLQDQDLTTVGHEHRNLEVAVEKFRGRNALYVSEPSEPDNINWQGIEVTPVERYARQLISLLLSCGVLAASFILTAYVNKVQPSSVVYVVAFVSEIFSFSA